MPYAVGVPTVGVLEVDAKTANQLWVVVACDLGGHHANRGNLWLTKNCIWILSPDQRFVLRTLVEREGTPRGAAIFALSYWAGCRVSDVAWLEMAQLHISSKAGWMIVGYKGGKQRTVDLHNAARRLLADYLASADHPPERRYVFPSQRSARLTEAGIHHWFRALKARATKTEWEVMVDITFHDLRHDFAHRARAAGWSLEEVAYYLGHLTKTGTPALQTTARYTQVSLEHVKPKLQQMCG